jgi:hypothetical protein
MIKLRGEILDAGKGRHCSQERAHRELTNISSLYLDGEYKHYPLNFYATYTLFYV